MSFKYGKNPRDAYSTAVAFLLHCTVDSTHTVHCNLLLLSK